VVNQVEGWRERRGETEQRARVPRDAACRIGWRVADALHFGARRQSALGDGFFDARPLYSAALALITGSAFLAAARSICADFTSSTGVVAGPATSLAFALASETAESEFSELIHCLLPGSARTRPLPSHPME